MTPLEHSGFHALLCLNHFMDSHSESIKHYVRTKKQLDNLYSSLIKLLLTDYESRHTFFIYGGEVDAVIDDNGKVIKIKVKE